MGIIIVAFPVEKVPVNENGRISADAIQAFYIGGVTQAFGNKQTYSAMVLNSGVNRPLLSGHEIFGHAYPMSLGRTNKEQLHIDAIQMENLIRRVMGITDQRDGHDHMNGEIINVNQ